MASKSDERTKTILVEAGDESMVFHIWQDVQIQEEMEMTDKPTEGGGRDQEIVRPLPPNLTFTVKASDEVQVPVVKGDAVDQSDLSMIQQVERLRSLKGQEVTVSAERLNQEVSGLVRRVEIRDDGQYDNVTNVTVTVQSFARRPTPEGATFGEEIYEGSIQIPVRKDPAQNQTETALPAAIHPKDALPKSGSCEPQKKQGEEFEWHKFLGGTLTAVGAGGAAAASAVPTGGVGTTLLGTASVAGASVAINEVRQAFSDPKESPTPETPEQVFKIYSDGSIAVDGKKMSNPQEAFSQALQSRDDDDWVDVDTEIKDMQVIVVPPDQTDQDPDQVEGDSRDIKPAAIKAAIMKYIPEKEGGTGEAIVLNPPPGGEKVPPLPPDQYKFANLRVQNLLDPTISEPKRVTTSQGTVTIGGDTHLLVHPNIFVTFASRVFRDTIGSIVDQKKYGEACNQ